MLVTPKCRFLRTIGDIEQRGRRHLEPARRRNEPAAEITKTIPILSNADGWINDKKVGRQHILHTRVVRVEHQHHWRMLLALVNQSIAYAKHHYSGPSKKNSTAVRGDTDIDIQTPERRGCARPRSPQRQRLVLVPSHGKPDQMLISDNAVGRIEIHPSRAGQKYL